MLRINTYTTTSTGGRTGTELVGTFNRNRGGGEFGTPLLIPYTTFEGLGAVNYTTPGITPPRRAAVIGPRWIGEQMTAIGCLVLVHNVILQVV